MQSSIAAVIRVRNSTQGRSPALCDPAKSVLAR